jgi:hypothetical protein
MNGQYILDGHNPIPVDDLLQWGQWLETADRVVGKDEIGDATVSTVFLGLDHSFGFGPPMLFETMIFGGPHDQEMERYSTWEEAEAGHQRWVQKLSNNREVERSQQ